MDEIKLNLVVNEPRIIKYQPTPLEQIKRNFKKRIEEMKKAAALNGEISKLVDKWIECMAECNAYNNMFHTYTLKEIEKEDYGWSCKIYAPYGLPIDDLEKYRKQIESDLKCVFIFTLADFKAYAIVQFIKNVNCNDILYKPQKVKSWECHGGVDASGKPMIFNMITENNIFLAGNTRKGKSKCNDHILTSHICNSTPQELEIYLIQLDKEDLIIYEDVEHVRGFADSFEKTDIMLEYITNEMKRRTEIMRPLKKAGLANNMYEYNQNTKGEKFPNILIDIDEFSSLVHEPSDSKGVKALKDSIVSKLVKIAQVGGAMGIYYIISVQRPTVDRVHPFIKAQSNVKIVFGVSNQKSSEVCLDNDMAVGLPPRRAITCVNGEFSLLFTTKLSDSDVLRYIKPHLKPGHKTIFDDLPEKPTKQNNSNKKGGKTTDESTQTPPTPPPQQPQQTFDKVQQQKSPEQLLQENISKIPGFVPWQPTDPSKVIDKTDEAIKPSPLSSKKGGKTSC